MSFEIFDARNNKGRQGHNLPLVANYESGRFAFNKSAEKLVGDARFVLVMVDEKTKNVAFQFLAEEDPRAYKITKSSSSSQLFISSRAITHHYQISFGRSELTVSGDFLVANFNEVSNV